MEVTLTRGISGSGKSTWAKKQVDLGQGGTVLVCKDDIRNMLWNGEYSKGRENIVKSVRNTLILIALNEGKNVIVADTNFDNHETDIRDVISKWAKENNKSVNVKIQSFEDVPLKTCIERDSKRDKPLGDAIIRGQYNKWLRKEENPNLIPWDHSKKTACCFDIDGTLTYGPNNRSPFEWKKVGQDLVRQPVKDLLKIHYLDKANTIIIVSGRDECCRKETETWLKDNDIPYHSLFMRQTEDNRPDEIIKEEIIDSKILPFYNIKIWVDDRLKVCRMLHKKGIPLFRVGDPDSDF